MRLALIILSLFFISTNAQSEEDFVLQVDPKKYQPGKFEKGLPKKVGTMPEAKSNMIPEKDLRESIFAQVQDLSPHLLSLDELGRDILFVRAKTLKLPELQKLYPKIPAKTLADLNKLARQKTK